MAFELDLLNFWIEKLGFLIEENNLYLCLQACNLDFGTHYKLFLCNDSRTILDFFGFDTSIDYLNLKAYNVFEFLCTTSKLEPSMIRYRGFKGPSAKNDKHAKFNDYLKHKFENAIQPSKDAACHTQSIWMESAIQVFSKRYEYNLYIEQKSKVDTCIDKLKRFNPSFQDMSRFFMLHGICSVCVWDEETLEKKWMLYQQEPWNVLTIFVR
jgi:hypothetical protein